MKKFYIIILAFIISISLPGCISNATNLGESYLLGQDDQFYYDHDVTGLMAESKNGYYFFSGPDSVFLYYMDKRTMKPVILCNKPDCLHTDETDPFKVMNCNACFYTNHNNLVYYDNYLYTGGSDAADTDISYSIYRVSLDGTQHKKIYTFKDIPRKWIIHRGYIYYAVDDDGTVEGREAETVSNCMLLKIDINNIGNGPSLLTKISGIYERTMSLFGYGNGIYWMGMGVEDEALSGTKFQVYKYDLLNGKTELFGDDINYISGCNGKIIYRKDGIMYKSNPDGSSREKIGAIRSDGKVSGYVFCDGFKYIYCDTLAAKQATFLPDYQEIDKTRKLLVFDLNGELVNTIDIDSIGVDSFYGGNNDYLFIPDNRSSSNEYGDIIRLWAIDTSKLDAGNPSIEKLFEFVPKVQFQGVAVRMD